MPHQSQAACMAIEDAAALGILFSEEYFTGNVSEALSMYQAVRLARVTKVQAAAQRASENINERIGKSQALQNWSIHCSNLPSGFSSNVDNPVYKVKSEQEKLTIEEMNGYVYNSIWLPVLICSRYDMYMHINELLCQNSGRPFVHKYIRGLPIGLELSNGFTVGGENWFFD